jgi:hypothetical protein
MPLRRRAALRPATVDCRGVLVVAKQSIHVGYRPRRTRADRRSRGLHLAGLRRRRPGGRGRPHHHQAHRPIQGRQTRTPAITPEACLTPPCPGLALGDRPQRVAGVGERVRLDRRIGQHSGPPQLDQPCPQLRDGSRLLFEELPGGNAEHGGVAQQPVHLDGGISPAANPRTSSRPSGANDRGLSVIRSPPTGSTTMSTARSPSTSRTAASQPATAEHDMIRPGPQRELLAGLVADHRDRAQPQRPPKLDRGGTDATGGTMHQQRLTSANPPTPDQREQAGQVIERSRRPGLEAHPLRQRQHPLRRAMTTSCQQPYDASTATR